MDEAPECALSDAPRSKSQTQTCPLKLAHSWNVRNLIFDTHHSELGVKREKGPKGYEFSLFISKEDSGP